VPNCRRYSACFINARDMHLAQRGGRFPTPFHPFSRNPHEFSAHDSSAQQIPRMRTHSSFFAGETGKKRKGGTGGGGSGGNVQQRQQSSSDVNSSGRQSVTRWRRRRCHRVLFVFRRKCSDSTWRLPLANDTCAYSAALSPLSLSLSLSLLSFPSSRLSVVHSRWLIAGDTRLHARGKKKARNLRAATMAR